MKAILTQIESGTETTNNPDGTKYIKKSDGGGGVTVDSYNADNKLTSSSKLDPDAGIKVETIEYDPDTRAITSKTTFNPVDGKPRYRQATKSVRKIIRRGHRRNENNNNRICR